MSDRTSSKSSGSASRVVLSFSPPDERTADALDADSYRSYLRRTRSGPASVGAEWDEFVSGGCGTTRDVTLRVESVRGGEEIGEETELVFEPSSE
ncbi:hypothetical protein [Halopelagius fulvigenes]|uniref:DUF7968 domain-containing protein n=1 Tax=Halopelagius fulvigenes TaxID=1198324 RepID=A0ABD5TZT3_9EURY